MSAEGCAACRPMKVRIYDCRLLVDLAARNAVLAAVLKIVAAIKLPPKYKPAGSTGPGGVRESLRSNPSGAAADQASGAVQACSSVVLSAAEVRGVHHRSMHVLPAHCRAAAEECLCACGQCQQHSHVSDGLS